MSSVQPDPFEIAERDGVRVATDGVLTVALMAPGGEGRLFRRRGVRGLAMSAPGARVLPELNRLAGDLLAQLDMPPEALAARLHELLVMAAPVEPQRVEWAVAELDGVRVYVGQGSVIVTRDDLVP